MRPRELLSTGVPRWTIHTETFRSDKSDRALKDLQELAVIAEQATPLAGNRLELCLRTRSNQVVLPSVEAALLRLKATIGELREKQQFIVTSKVMFPLDSLRTLAFPCQTSQGRHMFPRQLYVLHPTWISCNYT